MSRLPENIKSAIKSGPVPKLRPWRKWDINTEWDRFSQAEQVMYFIENCLGVPEGADVGKPIRLAKFQEAFIYAIYDNPHGTRKAYLSIARKNGKSVLISGLVNAHTVGPMAQTNSQVRMGALSRDQAAITWNHATKMLEQGQIPDSAYKSVSSGKSILGVTANVDTKAISSEAKTAHGLSPVLAVLDETGQVVGETDPFIEAITTSQGAHENPLLIAISTQAASDKDLFSQWIDDAERSNDPHTVCHVYKADEGCDLMSKRQWRKANPALGIFRNEKDLEEQIKQAMRIPAMENSVRNLLLNNRISLQSVWLAPAVYKANKAKPDWSVFRGNGVHIGLDLSQKNDLTVACLSAKDEHGFVHAYPYAFTPADGIAERSLRDRVPYDQWVRDGVITAVPGATISYDWVAEFLRIQLLDEGIEINSIEFDRWRIAEFRAACERSGISLPDRCWHEVGQGYKDMSPRIEALETALLQEKVRHGEHPVFNLGASSAIVVQDPSGNKKLDKSKASNKIDAIIALLMAAYPLIADTEAPPMDIAAAFG